MSEERSEADVVVRVPNYPPNKTKQEKRETPAKIEKKVEKVVTNVAIKRKKGLGSKFKEALLGDDARSVKDYIIYDVLVPSFKNLINEAIGGGIETLLFGSRKGSRTTRHGGQSYVNYGSYSSPRVVGQNSRRELSRTSRSRHDFDEIVLVTRGEAEEVLSTLVELVDEFGAATVGDLYDLVDIERTHVDEKYGWTDLRSSSVSRVRDGYLLNLPRAILLD